jgi:hypothetical protein
VECICSKKQKVVLFHTFKGNCWVAPGNAFRKRHIIVVDWCCVCKRDEESLDHLPLHCEVACALCMHFLVVLGFLGLCLEE